MVVGSSWEVVWSLKVVVHMPKFFYCTNFCNLFNGIFVGITWLLWLLWLFILIFFFVGIAVRSLAVLNSEYSLIIKLVDVNNHDSDNEKKGGTDANMTNISKSGSQSPEQLHILCRLLLLQSQLVYHNNRQEQTQKLDDAIQAQKDDTSSNSSKKHRNQSAPVDYSTGIYNRGSTSAASNSMTMTMRQNKKLQASFMKAPCILQSCVGLGTKVILERKVRKALRVRITYVTV